MSDLKAQKERVEKEIRKLEEMGGSVGNRAKRLRDSTFAKFPIIFIFLSTFGVVATFYGFEKIIDQIVYFEQNPSMVLVAGLLTLLITGTLYKKLN